MHVDDEVARVGVVDRLLRLRLPGVISGRVVGINTDDIEPAEIPELDLFQVREFTAENEMQQLRRLIRHGPVPRAVLVHPWMSRSCEFRKPIANNAKQSRMTGTPGSDQRAMDRTGLVVGQQLSRQGR